MFDCFLYKSGLNSYHFSSSLSPNMIIRMNNKSYNFNKIKSRKNTLVLV